MRFSRRSFISGPARGERPPGGGDRLRRPQRHLPQGSHRRPGGGVLGGATEPQPELQDRARPLRKRGQGELQLRIFFFFR